MYLARPTGALDDKPLVYSSDTRDLLPISHKPEPLPAVTVRPVLTREMPTEVPKVVSIVPRRSTLPTLYRDAAAAALFTVVIVFLIGFSSLKSEVVAKIPGFASNVASVGEVASSIAATLGNLIERFKPEQQYARTDQ